MPNLSCGIVGLPNVGKSTLFNALTKHAVAAAANYPFCTIDPNVGMIDMDDPRLDQLSVLSNSRQVIPAAVTFVDIAGLVAGASKGEGLGNQFLANIRETDAIVHVVRCFESKDIIHIAGKVDPIGDIAVIELELILADLQMAENVAGKIEKQMRGKKELTSVYEALKKAIVHLDQNRGLSTMEMTSKEDEILRGYPFLTRKKVIYAANVGESDLPKMANAHVDAVERLARAQGNQMVPICARLEEELAQLTPEEAKEYLEALGLTEPGLSRLVRGAFELLGLINFLTTGEIETRAWTIRKGTTAQVAAGQIHSDIQKGFIRAEVVSYEDMIACGGRLAARQQGKVRFEGKDYIIQDGDVILFLHH